MYSYENLINVFVSISSSTSLVSNLIQLVKAKKYNMNFSPIDRPEFLGFWPKFESKKSGSGLKNKSPIKFGLGIGLYVTPPYPII